MWSRFRLVCIVVATTLISAAPGEAAVLVLDQSVIYVAPGASVSIGATLYDPGLQTDASGDDNGEALSVAKVDHNFDAFTFTTAVPNPIANLNLSNVPSVHLTLGTITAKVGPLAFVPQGASDDTPPGTYTTDVGIYQPFGDPCGGLSGFCAVNPDQFPLPNFADGGILTIVVTDAVPEPAIWAMLILGFCGIGAVSYRRNHRAALIAA